MPHKLKTPHADRSPYGWWIFCEVQQWVEGDPKNAAKQKRFPVWENMRLLKARNYEQAYRKAIKLANIGMPSATEGGEWHFIGLSMLLPAYEALEDGAEILWTDHGKISAAKIKRMVKSKEKLSVP
ncbi:MAG TPA: hypothetical protein VF624_16875 [Tepidisphaeraceae bacterium]|jgi:hypothetical protein